MPPACVLRCSAIWVRQRERRRLRDATRAQIKHKHDICDRPQKMIITDTWEERIHGREWWCPK